MTSHTLRVVVATLLGAAAPLAGAHEFACEKTAGVLKLDASGGLATGTDGLPLFATDPSRILTLRSYPAVVGFRIRLENLASDTSVVTGVTDALLGAPGATVVGDAIAPGFSLPVGATATEVVAVTVASQEECLTLFGGAASDAPVCTDVAENRFVVEHDLGSAECRARVVCGAAPADGCGDLWHGMTEFGFGLGFNTGTGIALENACDLSVVAPDIVARGVAIARLDAAGDVAQYVNFGVGLMPPMRVALTDNIVVDAAGNRWVAWTGFVADHFEAIASRVAPDGTETLRFVVENATTGNPPLHVYASSIAVDAAGDAYLVGNAFGALPGFVVQGGTGVFVVKIDAATGSDVWKLQFGELASAAAALVLPNGVLLVAGGTLGSLPGNANAGGSDAFVARIAPDGNFASAVQFGTGREGASGMARDATGNVYLSGNAASTPLEGVHEVRAFLAKLDDGLNVLWYRELASSAQHANASGVAVDAAGNAWIVGSSVGTLPGGTDAQGEDGFVAKYDSSGDLMWITQLGAWKLPRAVAVDAAGNAYVTGGLFVAKLDPAGNLK